MKTYRLLLFSLLLVGCAQDPDQVLANLEGYWSIEKVVLEDGTDREYPFTSSLDHFTLTNNSGTKNRVVPRYDNVMVSTETPIPFKIKQSDSATLLVFEEGAAQYTQTLVKCSEEQLILEHENGMKYYYKPYDAPQNAE
ncbi:MAG: hypothetical protein WBA16_02610 [Nonlabens sp.]